MDVETDDDTDETKISLHALTGINSEKMQMLVQVHWCSWLSSTLSSMNNFISEDIVVQSSAHLTRQTALGVAVANGKSLTRAGVCRNMEVTFDSGVFHLECYTIPLGGFSMILEVKWLGSLGPILWYFNW